MKKRLLASIMAFTVLLSVVFIGAFSVSASVANDACNSVVVVCVCFDSEEYGLLALGSGTGFFVGKQGEDPGYLITNQHVVDSFENLGKGARVSVPMDDGSIIGKALIKVFYDSNDSEEAYVVESDSVKDVAVLKLASPTTKRVPLKICEPVEEMKGTQIYAIGYPGVVDRQISSTTRWGKGDASVVSGVLGNLYTESGTGINKIQVDMNITYGNSGGPVINSDGYAIGIATGGYMEQSINASGQLETEYVKYATSISEAVAILNKNGIAYDTAASGINNTDVISSQADDVVSESSQQSNSIVDQNPSVVSTTDVVKEDSSINGLVIVLIVIIAVLVLGGGAAVIILIMNKNKKEAAAAVGEAKAMAAAAVAQANTKKAYVRSLAAQHGNARIRMTSGMEIVIGRSRDCKISFTESTPGISGKHCSISYDEASASFILKDLKSTYGTFLQEGTKLTPNTPYRLRSGDRFYLGDKANMLCVELV